MDMNKLKLIIGAVSVILMLSITGMASPFTIDITGASPNQAVPAGNPTFVKTGTTTYSIYLTAMVNNSDMFNITTFAIVGSPTATVALNYTPGGPIDLMGGGIGHFHPNGFDPYTAVNGLNITIPANAPNGTIYTFTLDSQSMTPVNLDPLQFDNASFSRSVIVLNMENISGMKFNDSNDNGVKDVGEPGLSGWTINLTNSTGALVAQTTTDGSGNYAFLNVPAGNYTVSEVLQPGWTQTFPSSVTYNVPLGGTDVTGLNFGNFLQPPGSTGNISGMKFNDSNDNGVKDMGESGLPGWTIQLINQSSSTVVATTTTDANGNYSFTNIPIGNYIVAEVLKGGWAQTFPSSGTYSVTLTANATVPGLDFGNFRQPPPSKVPAFTPIGIAALAGLLGLLAIVTIRRRL